ncbi:MAG TPA: pilus assembly protein CpaE [Sphingomicrobium sp.]|nr:pilus assembly protein CpaE [Sphingomicrobium sp.]
MSVITPNETTRSWHASKRELGVHLYLSGIEGDSAELAGARVGGFPLHLSVAPVTDWIDPQELSQAAAAVVQVDPDTPASIKRFQKLAQATETPLIAAAYDPPLALVRALVRFGAHDVVPLPLSIEDLETSIGPLRDEIRKSSRAAEAGKAKLITVVKGLGGIGATALTSQLAIRFAHHEAARRRETCLIDLDVQFGDVAFQLGLHPKLSLLDLLEAGTRLDSALLRSTTTDHASGLKVIAAPPEMMPLEGISSDHLIEVVDLATREFGTVFLDLPSNWTNWSLSLVARSNVVLLVTELSVAGLNRAKKQLQLFDSQDLGGLDVRVVANRFDKAQSRGIRAADVRQALGRDISYTISNDPQLMRTAIDRGVPLGDLKRKSALGKDIDMLDAGIAAAVGLER